MLPQARRRKLRAHQRDDSNTIGGKDTTQTKSLDTMLHTREDGGRGLADRSGAVTCAHSPRHGPRLARRSRSRSAAPRPRETKAATPWPMRRPTARRGCLRHALERDEKGGTRSRLGLYSRNGESHRKSSVNIQSFVLRLSTDTLQYTARCIGSLASRGASTIVFIYIARPRAKGLLTFIHGPRWAMGTGRPDRGDEPDSGLSVSRRPAAPCARLVELPRRASSCTAI